MGFFLIFFFCHGLQLFLFLSLDFTTLRFRRLSLSSFSKVFLQFLSFSYVADFEHETSSYWRCTWMHVRGPGELLSSISLVLVPVLQFRTLFSWLTALNHEGA